MYKSLLLFLLLFLSAQKGYSQTTFQELVLVVNGGVFEIQPPYTDYVTVALFNPQTRQYTVADTIFDQSVTDAIVVGDTAYISTDNGLAAYKLPELIPIAKTGGMRGLRKLAVYGNKILATRGFPRLPGEGFVYVYDRNTLAKTGEFTGIEGETEHILVDGNRAYVGVQYDFMSDSGSMAVLNLQSGLVVNVLHLGSAGKGIVKLYKHGTNLKALTTQGFGAQSGTILTINPTSFSFASTPTGYTIGTVASYARGDTVYGQFGTSGIAKISLNTNAVTTVLPRISLASIQAGQSSVFAAKASFTSSSVLYRLSSSGEVLDSVQIGASPEAIVVFQSEILSLTNSNEVRPGISCYPNPFINKLNIKYAGQERVKSIQVFDLLGKCVNSTEDSITELNLGHLLKGTYRVQVTYENSISNFNISKI